MKEKLSILEKIFDVKPENIGLKKILFNPNKNKEYIVSMLIYSAYSKNKIYSYLTMFKDFVNYNIVDNDGVSNEYIISICVSRKSNFYKFCEEIYDVSTFYNNKKMIKKIVEIFKFKNLIR